MASDDGIVRIGTEVDLSNLRSSMIQAEANVREAAGQMSAAWKAFGSAAAQGNDQAIAALAEHKAALGEAQSALQRLIDVENEESGALRANISARMAASSELRVLEGNMMGSTRAAGAFLSMLPGLSSAMQVAFPVFGAVALVEILGRAVKSVGELVSAYKDLDGAAIKASTDAIIAGEKIVTIKPSFDANAAARMYAGAGLQPDITVQNASAKLKEIEYARQLADAQAAINEQGKTGVALQQQKVADAQKDLQFARDAKAEADALVESYRKQLEAKTMVVDGAAIFSTMAAVRPTNTTVDPTQEINTITDPKQVAAVQQQLKTAAEAVQEFQHQIDLAKVHLEGAQLKIPEVDDKAFKASMEAHLAAQKQATEMIDEASKAEEAARGKVGSVAEGSPLQQSILSALSSTDTKGQQQLVALSEMLNRASEATKHLETDTKSSTDALDQAEEAYSKLGDAQVEAYDIGQKNADAMAQAVLRAQEALHATSAHTAAIEQAALHTKEYTQAMAALNAQLEVYQQAGKAPEAAQTQNQMAQLQGSAMVQAVADQATIQKTVVQPWQNAFNEISQSWIQVTNQLMYSTRNVGQDFAKMGQQLVIYAMDAAEKWALAWIGKELMAELFHKMTAAQWLATEQAKNTTAGLSTQQLYLTQTISAQSAAASVTAANATALSSGLATNTALAQSYAGVAAAAAAASVAAIPVTGWAMAPGVAAATYAETAAFAAMASLDTGTGYVPTDGIAMLHQGEAVIPAPTMEDLRGSSGGGDRVTIQQHNNFHGCNPDKEFQRQLYRNASHVAAALQKHLRQRGKA